MGVASLENGARLHTSEELPVKSVGDHDSRQSMASADSPGSPLSSLASEDFAEGVKEDEDIEALLQQDRGSRSSANRPAKRQRIGSGWEAARRDTPDIIQDLGGQDLSSDTEGSVPGSPTHHHHHPAGAPDEETLGQEQVTACQWDGCRAGDLGNMDLLVEHLHEEHIGQRQKKYSCEWGNCPRKGTSHASGYALRAHMRSHTREKPFYCSLPECDRSFTRSDALAKHMRTVHETEVLRPSDPVPRNHSTFPTNRLQRLRLVFTNSSAHAAKGSPITPSEQGLASQIEDGATPTREHEKKGTIYDASLYERIPPSGSRRHPSAKWAFPPDVDFTTAEANLRLDQLFRLLRRQRAWAEAEGEKLSREVADLEEQRHREWVYKELVLENVLEAECSVAEKRAARKRQRKSIDGVEGDMNIRRAIRETALKATSLAIDGDLPWWRREPLLGVEADRIDRDNGGRGGGTDDEIEGATEEPLSMPAKSVEVA